jgi:hypothetical protein
VSEVKQYPHVIAVDSSGRKTLTVFLPGLPPIIKDDNDPMFERLLFEAEQGELSPQQIKTYVLER